MHISAVAGRTTSSIHLWNFLHNTLAAAQPQGEHRLLRQCLWIRCEKAPEPPGSTHAYNWNPSLRWLRWLLGIPTRLLNIMSFQPSFLQQSGLLYLQRPPHFGTPNPPSAALFVWGLDPNSGRQCRNHLFSSLCSSTLFKSLVTSHITECGCTVTNAASPPGVRQQWWWEIEQKFNIEALFVSAAALSLQNFPSVSWNRHPQLCLALCSCHKCPTTQKFHGLVISFLHRTRFPLSFTFSSLCFVSSPRSHIAVVPTTSPYPQTRKSLGQSGTFLIWTTLPPFSHIYTQLACLRSKSYLTNSPMLKFNPSPSNTNKLTPKLKLNSNPT